MLPKLVRQLETPSRNRLPHVSNRRHGRGFPAAFAAGVLILTGCRPHDFPQYPANYREYAYVTNGGSNTVSIYDVVNVRLDREVQVGTDPVAVVPSTTRNEVYVVNSGAPGSVGSVSVIDAERNTVAATIPVHRRPVAIALDPDNSFAYVANSGSNNVSVIDLKVRREVGAIGTGEDPVSVRVSPDGKTLAVANRAGNSVSLIDTATRRVRAAFGGCPGADDVVILPDSTKAFAACSAGHQILAIAIAHPGHPGQHDGSAVDRVEALLDVGREPVHLALKPDGGEIFVANALSDTISEVITGTDDVLGAYLMGAEPVRGIVSADNSLLYVGNRRSQEITIYSIDDGARVKPRIPIHVGSGISALAFSAAGHLLFVVDAGSGDVAVVRTLDDSLFTILPAGHNPNAIAIKAFKVS
jgi:YVTN family beta-propeller protein